MGITLHLKHISLETLEILKQDITQIDIFYDAEWPTKDKLENKYTSSTHLNLFLSEWETSDLDLHKYYPELTYILAGYIPDYGQRNLALPELQARSDLMQKDNFMDFLIIEDSEWDGLPLVNALWTGVGIGEERATWYQTPEQVGDILDALLWIADDGFRERCERECELDRVGSWIDWEEEEMIDWLTDYYNQIFDYYQCASQSNKAMLIDLSM
jgi:Domain of unknown function (DUF1877)